MVAARERSGDGWGILFEVVQGDLAARDARWPATIQQYRYGSRVAPGGRYRVDCRPIGLRLRAKVEPAPFALPGSLDGIVVTAPTVGKFQLTDDLCERLDLRPGRSSSGRIESWLTVLAIRAVLAMDQRAFWNPPDKAVRSLRLRQPVVLVATDAFEHVEGPVPGGKASGKLRRLPSRSPVFRSLAAAIAGGDPGKFDPGKPNTDWRLHAKKRTAGGVTA